MKSSWKRLWMLVSVLVLVGSLAGCGIFGGDDDDDNGEEEDPETVTVYFYNSEDWDEVHAYSDDVEGMGSPGEEATQDPDEDDWYMIEIERDVLSDPMDVVFHNNDGDEADPATIDHPNQIFVTAKGDVFGSRGGVEDEMNATLYFYNSEEWSNVHVQSDDIEALSDNPEVDEDPDNEDWYTVTVPTNLTENPISVTFNDGDVSTGTELELDDHSKTYLTVQEDGIYSSKDAATSGLSGVYTTVYFYTEEWDTVNAWAWTDDGDVFDEWPGEPAEEVDDRDGWYSIDLPGVESTDSLEVIFNDGTDQTDDTPIDGDNVYVVYEGHEEVGSTYESFDEAESGAEEVTFDLWFYNDQGWDSVYVDAEDSNDESLLDATEATQDGDTDWWSIEVPADLDDVDVDVTFHDNDGNEGDTITIEDEDDYYLTSDKDVMYQGRTQVYFNNEDEWTDVYADIETDVATPEAFMTDVEALQDGDSDWYFVDVPVNFDDDEDTEDTDYTITFHDDNGNEAPSAPLTADSDKYITMTEDETYSTLNQAETWMNASSDDFITVYYYNSEGWDVEDMHAYTYSNVDELNEILGLWPGMSVEEDPDDSDWVRVDIPVDLSQLSDGDEFNMIFNGENGDVESDSILLESESELYLAYSGNAYADKESAEEAMASTEVTFYNTDEWDTVYADAETDDETLLTDEEATQDGDTAWWTVEVPTSLAMEDVALTFHDGSDKEVDVSLTDGDNLIINMDGISDYETRALNELYYDQDTSGYTDVYFYNAGDWSDVNAYAWNDDDSTPFAEWPGSPAFTDDDDEDWLYIGADWDLDADSYEILFHGNDGDIQTKDITLPDSTDVYITPYGTVHESKDEAESEVESRASTEVHFYNSEDWTNVHAWAWTDDGNLFDDEWPGPEMTDSGDDGWYTIDVPQDAWLSEFSMLVNDGGDPATQTVNITIDNTDDVYIVLDGDSNDDGHLTIEQFDDSDDAEASLTD